MARGSELATWRWVRQRSALGELLDVDFEAMPLMRLFRVSDLLVKHREALETALFSRVQTLFGLPTTVTFYDLTNTYFEGTAAANPRAAGGRSKEERSDSLLRVLSRPLVTLGLVLDASGFVRKSKMCPGNAAEAATLPVMLKGLDAPPAALVIMDAGIATAANITWLGAQGFRYLVVSRTRPPVRPDQASETPTASNQTIRLQRVVSEDAAEVRLYCHSQRRESKETALSDRFVKRFEDGLRRLAEALVKPRGQKTLDAIHERTGRLKENSRGIAQHYVITVTPDATGKKAAAITWNKTPRAGSMLTHPEVYCLRSNETTCDAEKLWRTYTMLTDLEAVFRSLKSDLGLRPVFHHKEHRTEGHLFITVLAYQLVQAIRWRLKEAGQHACWASLREILPVQQRVTATFQQRDGRTLHVRKTTTAEPALRTIYDALAIDPAPGRIRKYAA